MPSPISVGSPNSLARWKETVDSYASHYSWRSMVVSYLQTVDDDNAVRLAHLTDIELWEAVVRNQKNKLSRSADPLYQFFNLNPNLNS